MLLLTRRLARASFLLPRFFASPAAASTAPAPPPTKAKPAKPAKKDTPAKSAEPVEEAPPARLPPPPSLSPEQLAILKSEVVDVAFSKEAASRPDLLVRRVQETRLLAEFHGLLDDLLTPLECLPSHPTEFTDASYAWSPLHSSHSEFFVPPTPFRE